MNTKIDPDISRTKYVINEIKHCLMLRAKLIRTAITYTIENELSGPCTDPNYHLEFWGILSQYKRNDISINVLCIYRQRNS